MSNPITSPTTYYDLEKLKLASFALADANGLHGYDPILVDSKGKPLWPPSAYLAGPAHVAPFGGSGDAGMMAAAFRNNTTGEIIVGIQGTTRLQATTLGSTRRWLPMWKFRHFEPRQLIPTLQTM